MALHRTFTQFTEIPAGFRTYSVLLIPDSAWLPTLGEAAFEFFRAYKSFGDIIGPEHLSGWFLRGGLSGHMDADISAVLGGDASTLDGFRRYYDALLTKIGHGYQPEVRYDYERARLICARLHLEYADGPYVTFFTRRPKLPYYRRKDLHPSHHSDEQVGTTVTKPTYILRFGSLPLPKCLKLLGQLEAALLRQDPALGSLRFKQVLEHTKHWLSNNADNVVKLLETAIKLKGA